MTAITLDAHDWVITSSVRRPDRDKRRRVKRHHRRADGAGDERKSVHSRVDEALDQGTATMRLKARHDGSP
jgi:hypothetical protein